MNFNFLGMKLYRIYEIKKVIKSYIKRIKIAKAIVFNYNRVSFFTTIATEKKTTKEFPRYCKNIKWYPGLPDGISIYEVGEYFYNGVSHYYRFPESGMLISCWEISARKTQLEFWNVSNECF